MIEIDIIFSQKIQKISDSIVMISPFFFSGLSQVNSSKMRQPLNSFTLEIQYPHLQFSLDLFLTLFGRGYSLSSFHNLKFLLTISLSFHRTCFHKVIQEIHTEEYHKMFRVVIILSMLTSQNHIFQPYHNTSQYSMVLYLYVLYYIHATNLQPHKLPSKSELILLRAFLSFFALNRKDFLLYRVLATNRCYQHHRRQKKA